MAKKTIIKKYPMDLKRSSSNPVSKDYLEHVSYIASNTVETDKKLLKCKVTHLNIIDYLVWSCRGYEANKLEDDGKRHHKSVVPTLKNMDDTVAVYKVTIDNYFLKEMFKFSNNNSSNCGVPSLYSTDVNNKYLNDLIYSVKEFFLSNLVTFEESEKSGGCSITSTFIISGLTVNKIDEDKDDIISNIKSIDFSVNMNVVRKLFPLKDGGYGYTNLIDQWCLNTPLSWLLFKMINKDLKWINQEGGKIYTIEYIARGLGVYNKILEGSYRIDNLYRDIQKAIEDINEETNFYNENNGNLVFEKISNVEVGQKNKVTHILFKIEND